jgi:uncharacterized protein YgbK (DUF1537 family)
MIVAQSSLLIVNSQSSIVNPRMNRIAVIADDLTGAADTGVQFSSFFEETLLVFYEDLTYFDLPGERARSRALSIYTNTRALSPEQAGRKLVAAAGNLVEFGADLVYKKVDSCLRGNLGSEIEALLDEMGYEVSFVVPAFPAMGRTTVHDIHLVHGVPVAQTELAKDPRTPVTESRLSALLGGQARYAVGHVDLRVLESGHEALQAEVGDLLLRGSRHVAFDAANQGHLDRIARLALASPRKILLVGSAGLAAGVASLLPRRPGRVEWQEPAVSSGHDLLVCGTTSEVTRQQIVRLCEIYPHEDISLSIDQLVEPAGRVALLDRASWVRSRLAAANLILRIEPLKDRLADCPHDEVSENILEGLGVLVKAVVQHTKPAGLFLTGGDSAHAVLHALGTRAIRLYGEVVTGMVQGVLVGGLMDGYPVVTKAGAFGKPDALVVLHESRQRPVKES